MLDFAYRRGVPLVATNEPFFATAGDFEAHDALLCIAGGTVTSVAERRRLTPTHYFRTRREMLELFADLPEINPKQRGNRTTLLFPAARAGADHAALHTQGARGSDAGAR